MLVERIYREVRAAAIPGGSEEILLDFAMRQVKYFPHIFLDIFVYLVVTRQVKRRTNLCIIFLLQVASKAGKLQSKL
jgi:hypothetical protein